MLCSLNIENIALIDRLELPLSGGFVVLTGETGAGKSIIIDSVNLLSGGRADRDLIKSGTEKAVAEGVFSVSESVCSALAEAGIACNVHYKPMPMFTAYKKLGYRIEDYPNAYNRYKNLITLPYHTFLSAEQVEYIADNLKRAVRI